MGAGRASEGPLWQSGQGVPSPGLWQEGLGSVGWMADLLVWGCGRCGNVLCRQIFFKKGLQPGGVECSGDSQSPIVSLFRVCLYYKELPSPRAMLPHGRLHRDQSEPSGRRLSCQSRAVTSPMASCLVGRTCFRVQHLLPSCVQIFSLALGFSLSPAGLGVRGLAGSFRGSVVPGRRGGQV